MQRRHDIDALRALAFALVILYHVAMYYVAGWHWHLKSPDAATWLQWPMRALNLWRMDLVFLVSGLAFGFLQRGGTGRPGLLRQRSWRLLLPLAFGMLVVVPFQPYAQALANGSTGPGFVDFLRRYFGGGPWPRGAFDGSDFGITWNHLWYLPYLWLYTAALLLVLPWLRQGAGARLHAAFLRLRGWRLVAWPLAPLALWSLLLWPHFPPTHDLVGDAWLHAVYFTLFLYGWWIGVDAGWWAEVLRLRWNLLALSGAAFVAYLTLRALASGPTLAARLAADLYLWTTVLALLGWAHRLLNRPWRWLPWANESVYPWYVLHQTVIIVLVFWLAPLRWPAVLEAPVVVAGTILGCWGLTAVIRRSRWLRPLFGLPAVRPPAPPRCPSPAWPAPPAAHSGGSPGRPCPPGTS
ncbi:acyltransferase family protein [Ramlibacter pallidus]|uniref:Acyltransferase family protein n=1 Tax=Ramlibacter pallidus TaxID=2780087 RepID=A0ABR9S2G6_9BURK|nr:acyltransferase family protein [Ramlibacter pallidus]MBE7367693.1 acyltransferase family protein [Ramlibacter pallidus]